MMCEGATDEFFYLKNIIWWNQDVVKMLDTFLYIVKSFLKWPNDKKAKEKHCVDEISVWTCSSFSYIFNKYVTRSSDHQFRVCLSLPRIIIEIVGGCAVEGLSNVRRYVAECWALLRFCFPALLHQIVVTKETTFNIIICFMRYFKQSLDCIRLFR